MAASPRPDPLPSLQFQTPPAFANQLATVLIAISNLHKSQDKR